MLNWALHKKKFTATKDVGPDAKNPDNATKCRGNRSLGFSLNLLKYLFKYSYEKNIAEA